MNQLKKPQRASIAISWGQAFLSVLFPSQSASLRTVLAHSGCSISNLFNQNHLLPFPDYFYKSQMQSNIRNKQINDKTIQEVNVVSYSMV